MAKTKIQDLIRWHVLSASNITEKKHVSIELSPRMQELTGGIRSGTSVIITGPEKMGKTSTILDICARGKKQHDYDILYCDAEHRLEKRSIINSGLGLDTPIVRSYDDKVISAESYLDIVDEKLKSKKPTIVVVDSVSAMCPENLFDHDARENYRDRTPMIMSMFTKLAAPYISMYGHIIIYVLHEIADTGYGPQTKTMSGGNKVRYVADYILRAYKKELIIPPGDNGAVGQNVFWEAKTSNMGKPGVKVVSRLDFQYGIDEAAEILEIACELAVISRKGSWYAFEEQKIQGELETLKYIRNNPEIYQKIKLQVAEFLN